MPKERKHASQEPKLALEQMGYLQRTLLPLNNLVFILPLLAIFHLGSARLGSNLATYRIIERLLGYFGATADLLPPLLIVVVLLAQHLARRGPWKVQGKTLAGMVAESILWTIPLIGISQLTGRLATYAAPAAQVGLLDPVRETLHRIVPALGAGVYEEFAFRLVLISLVLLVFVDIFSLKKQAVTVSAIILSAVVFSMCHFSQTELVKPSELDWPKALFLAAAGGLWACLYVFRGLGIAAGSHVMWDLYVAFCTSS